jgi:hypothetical protein
MISLITTVLNEKINLKNLQKKYLDYDLITLEVKSLNGKEDVVGNKILKAFNYIKDKIIKEGWKIKDCNWEWKEKIIFYYIVEKKKLNKEIIHFGPPKKLKEHVLSFRKKWKNYKVLEDNHHVYIKLKRKFIEINPFIKNLIKDKYFKNLVKKINMVKN